MVDDKNRTVAARGGGVGGLGEWGRMNLGEWKRTKRGPSLRKPGVEMGRPYLL